MGIQVTVEEKDLEQAKIHGFVISYVGFEHYEQGSDGEDFISLVPRMKVTFPSGESIVSYLEDCLCFDNKNVNHGFREELEKYKVPYVRG